MPSESLSSARMPAWTPGDKISSSKKDINYTESGPHLWFQFMKSLLVPKPATFGATTAEELDMWIQTWTARAALSCSSNSDTTERLSPLHKVRPFALELTFTEKQTHVGLFLAGRGAEPAFREKAWYYGVLFSWKPLRSQLRLWHAICTAGHTSHGLNARQDSVLLYKHGQVGTMWLKDRHRRLLTPSAFISCFLSVTDRCPQKPGNGEEIPL